MISFLHKFVFISSSSSSSSSPSSSSSISFCCFIIFILFPTTFVHSRTLHINDFIDKPETSDDHQILSLFSAYEIEQILACSDDSSVYVSSANQVMKVNYDTMTVIDSLQWNVSKDQGDQCRQTTYLPLHSCQHYTIKVMFLHNHKENQKEENRLVICLAYSMSSFCTERAIHNLSHNYREWHGGKAPLKNALKTVSAQMGSDGNLYLGTFVDNVGNDPAFVKVVLNDDSNKNELRSESMNIFSDQVLFVSSFEMKSRMFFLYNEISFEYFRFCQQKVGVTRLASVCLNDFGRDREWTTLIKIDVHCPYSDSHMIYTRLLQAKVLVDQGLFIGLFATPSNSPQSTAICIYSLEKVNQLMRGQFMLKNELKRSEVNNSMQCRDYPWAAPPLPPTVSRLLYRPWVPMSGSADFISINETWTHVAVDIVRRNSQQSLRVYFVATSRGQLKKLFEIGGQQCVAEVIDMLPKYKTDDLITNLHLIPDKDILMVSTNSSVIKMSTARCIYLTTADLCEQAQDPYCYWSPDPLNQCVHIHHHRSSSSTLNTLSSPPSIVSCPQEVRNPIIYGQWSRWTDWKPCDVTRPYVGSCQCRQRFCNPPRALSCSGQNIEVRNCRLPGVWSGWGDWSACSVTCGKGGQRSRKRTCVTSVGNDGTIPICSGSDVQYDNCELVPQCEALSQSQWHSWSSWSNCSIDCPTGVRRRVRSCYHLSNTDPCPGLDQQVESCTHQQCHESLIVSLWTPWVTRETNTDGFHKDVRYRIQCTSTISTNDYNSPTTPLPPPVDTEIQHRQCSSRQCVNQDSINDFKQYSDWSSWSTCSSPCSSYRSDRLSPSPGTPRVTFSTLYSLLGVQNKSRQCSSYWGDNTACAYSPKQLIQFRPCPLYECEVSWSCWSDWLSCSSSCTQPGTSGGVQIRQRECLNRENQPASGCPGVSAQNRPCETLTCTPQNGWGSWLPWSECLAGISRKQRVRFCYINGQQQNSTLAGISQTTTTFIKTLNISNDKEISPLCSGPWNELDWCASISGTGQTQSDSNCKNSLILLIVIVLCSFVFGVGVVVTFYVICYHCCCTEELTPQELAEQNALKMLDTIGLMDDHDALETLKRYRSVHASTPRSQRRRRQFSTSSSRSYGTYEGDSLPYRHSQPSSPLPIYSSSYEQQQQQQSRSFDFHQSSFSTLSSIIRPSVSFPIPPARSDSLPPESERVTRRLPDGCPPLPIARLTQNRLNRLSEEPSERNNHHQQHCVYENIAS